MQVKGGGIMTIGERIKKVRTDKKITQAELAIMCGYANKANISRIEHSGDNVTTKQVKRIADKLGVTEAFLMGYEPQTPTASIIVNDPVEIELIKLLRNNDKNFSVHLLTYALFVQAKNKDFVDDFTEHMKEGGNLDD